MVRIRSRGFTFIEVSLVMAFTLGLLTLIGLYFAKGQRYSAQTRAYVEAHSYATTIVRRVTDQAYRCTLSQRDIDADAVVLLSYGALESDPNKVELEFGTGRIAWKKWVGFYFDSDQKTVFQGELPLIDELYNLEDDAEPRLKVTDLRTDPAVKRTPLPGKVRNFRVSTVGDRLRVEVTTESQAAVSGNESEKLFTVKVTGEVAIYN